MNRMGTIVTTAAVALAVSVALIAAAPQAGSPQASGQAPQASQAAPPMSPDLALNQAQREYDQFHYENAVQILDNLVATLTANNQVLRPEILTQAYALRARARFSNGDESGCEQDFARLLLLTPSYKLVEGVSPKVKEIFDNVRKLTIGQALLSLNPEGEILIDGRQYSVGPTPQPVDLPVGEHQIVVNRPGYRPVSQKMSVTPTEPVTLSLTLERVSSTLAVFSQQEGVDVLLDGTPKGKTAKVPNAPDAPATIMITDLQTGPHRLQLRKDCFKEIEQTIPIQQHGDLKTDTLSLVAAVAKVTFKVSEPGTALFMDGQARGLTPTDLTVCEGKHVIELRGPKGRFVDGREWKTGDNVTLAADLRSAFPIVASKSGASMPAEQLRANVEQALKPVKSLLVYAPAEAELTSAMRDAAVPADWLGAELGGGATAVRVPKEVKRDLVKKLTARLQVQGIAAVFSGQDPYLVTVLLFAAGSGEPDVVTLNLADAATRGRTLDALSQPLPSLVRPSLETSMVDLAGVKGAVVIRPDGAGAKMGLEAGDVIIGAAGTPVNSVADVRAKIATLKPASATIAFDVRKGPNGAQRTVTGPVSMVPETLPLQDAGLLYNHALLSLQDMAKAATTPAEQSSLHVNLGIVMMRLGNFEDALAEFNAAKLPEGAGVSAGTVSYLIGRCEEALGHTANASAAYTKAAASPKARLSSEGPLIAPLAQQRLHPRGGN